MKKIISTLLVAMLLATCVFAAIPASAAKELTIDWSKLNYTVYNENGVELDESTIYDSFNVTKTQDSLSLDRIGGGIQANSYISTSQFTITATTKYTYEVMAKNNYTAKYSGVPFAIDPDGNVYFIYGSFDNNNDTDETNHGGESYVISAQCNFDNKYPNTTKNEKDDMYFAKLQQTDGFASFKFVYDGFTVTIYAKNTTGIYVQMGEVVPIPDGSKIAIGVYSRDNSGGGNRTTTVKNAKIIADNTEAENYLVLGESNGASELKAEIAKAKQDYNEADYTESSFAELKSAISDAESIANNAGSTASDIATVRQVLQAAVDGLEFKKVDKSALEDAIAEAEEINEEEWTVITYGVLADAIEAGKAILEDEDAKQSDVDKALESIMAKIDGLVPSGNTSEEDEDVDADESEETEEQTAPIATQPIIQQPIATQPPVKTGGRGCGMSVSATSVVIGIVATLGTALVIKKKD